jgi:hypothetical protein
VRLLFSVLVVVALGACDDFDKAVASYCAQPANASVPGCGDAGVGGGTGAAGGGMGGTGGSAGGAAAGGGGGTGGSAGGAAAGGGTGGSAGGAGASGGGTGGSAGSGGGGTTAASCCRDVSIGGAALCAVLTDGTVECLGNAINQYGGTYNGVIAFTQVDGGQRGTLSLNGVSSMSSATDVHCVVLTDSTVRCMGNVYSYQYFATNIDGGYSPPRTLPGVGPADQVFTGDATSCVLLDGGLTCWGPDDFTSWPYGPRSAGLPGASSFALSRGSNYPGSTYETFCEVADAGVWCWGNNYWGQLGRPAGYAGTILPGQVVGLPPVTQVVMGYGHGCALDTVGEVWCWGNNASLQLGVADAGTDAGAHHVDGLAGALELAAGSNHTCARLGDGGVLCWGSPFGGALGCDAGPLCTGTLNRPVLTAAVDRIFAGQNTGCALSGQQLSCWGDTRLVSTPLGWPVSYPYVMPFP